jgi:hypothetical protein
MVPRTAPEQSLGRRLKGAYVKSKKKKRLLTVGAPKAQDGGVVV